MTDIIDKLASLITIDIDHDPLVSELLLMGENASTAEKRRAIAKIIRILVLEQKSPQQYLADLFRFSDNAVMSRYLASGGRDYEELLKNDLATLSTISSTASSRILHYMGNVCGYQLENIEYLFKNGQVDWSVASFAEYARKHGSGIFARYKSFTLQGETLVPSENPSAIRFSDLKEYTFQLEEVKRNMDAFISGRPAQNTLLYGDRGTGKSSTVNALINEYEAVRLISVEKENLPLVPKLYEQLKDIPLRFVLFFDDLTFLSDDPNYHLMKKVLEGAGVARPDNLLIFATTNRRHFVKERVDERDRDVFHRGDDLDDNVSLADRFGLYLTYSIPNKDLYFKIVLAIAREKLPHFDEKELLAGAERFALKRGGRSPRIAQQYICMMMSEKKGTSH